MDDKLQEALTTAELLRRSVEQQEQAQAMSHRQHEAASAKWQRAEKDLTAALQQSKAAEATLEGTVQELNGRVTRAKQDSAQHRSEAPARTQATQSEADGKASTHLALQLETIAVAPTGTPVLHMHVCAHQARIN